MLVKVNGVVYHITIVGKGHPLILLHGFTGSTNNWKSLIPYFESDFKMIMIDLIGHGSSESPADWQRYQMAHVVDDLYSIMTKLDVQKVSILGYSMGGRVAIAFAAAYPEMVYKLILESSSPGLEDRQEALNRINHDEGLAEKIEQNGVDAFINFWEKLPLFKRMGNLPEQVKTDIRAQRLNNSPVGLANSLRGMGTGRQSSFWGILPMLPLPTLLLVGKEDEKFCRIASEMQKILPNGTMKVVEHAGHNIHVEYADFFAKIVRDYILKRC